jgi:hypothetical protein
MAALVRLGAAQFPFRKCCKLNPGPTGKETDALPTSAFDGESLLSPDAMSTKWGDQGGQQPIPQMERQRAELGLDPGPMPSPSPDLWCSGVATSFEISIRRRGKNAVTLIHLWGVCP